MFLQEGQSMLKQAKELIRIHNKQSSFYLNLHSLDYIKPLMEVIWSPLLATFSVVFESSNEKEVVNLCLEGLSKTIRLLAIFGMDDARDTVVISLVKFANVNHPK